MKITVNISKKCIASGTRKAYEDRVKQCLKGTSPDPGTLEREVEALKAFLETVDFPDLRSRHPALAGGQEREAVLHIAAPGDYALEVLGEIIYPFQK